MQCYFFLLRSKKGQVYVGSLEINNEVENKPAFRRMEIKAELPSLELNDDGEDPLKNGHPPRRLTAPPRPHFPPTPLFLRSTVPSHSYRDCTVCVPSHPRTQQHHMKE